MEHIQSTVLFVKALVPAVLGLGIAEAVDVPQAIAGSIMFSAGIWGFNVVRKSYDERATHYRDMWESSLESNEALQDEIKALRKRLKE